MAGDRRVEHHLDHHYRLHCRPDRARVFPGPPHPKGFLLTTVLGIVGAFVATFIGQRASAGIGSIRALASSVRRLAR
jgi:hypothetical protein